MKTILSWGFQHQTKQARLTGSGVSEFEPSLLNSIITVELQSDALDVCANQLTWSGCCWPAMLAFVTSIRQLNKEAMNQWHNQCNHKMVRFQNFAKKYWVSSLFTYEALFIEVNSVGFIFKVIFSQEQCLIKLTSVFMSFLFCKLFSLK